MGFNSWVKGQKRLRLDVKIIDIRRDAYNAGLEAAAVIVENKLSHQNPCKLAEAIRTNIGTD